MVNVTNLRIWQNGEKPVEIHEISGFMGILEKYFLNLQSDPFYRPVVAGSVFRICRNLKKIPAFSSQSQKIENFFVKFIACLKFVILHIGSPPMPTG